MNSMIAPYQLQKGIFLEKRRTLLGWEVAPMELEKTADQKTAHADLVWRGEEVLGGLFG